MLRYLNKLNPHVPTPESVYERFITLIGSEKDIQELIDKV